MHMDLHRARCRSAEFLRDRGPMAVRAPGPGAEGKCLAEPSMPVNSSVEAATALRVPTKGSAEQLDAKQLSQEAQSRSAESLALRDTGSGPERKETGNDVSRQPSSAAASRASAALLLMTGATGPHGRASRLTHGAVDIGAAVSSSMPATVECKVAFSGRAEQPPRSVTMAVAELSEPVSSVEAATGLRAPILGNADRLDAKQLSQEAQIRCAELPCDELTAQAPGLGSEGKETGKDASRQPSSAAASRASAAYLLMNGALGTPRRGGRLTGAKMDMGVAVSGSMQEAVGCEVTFSARADEAPSSVTASATELSEHVSSSLEAATELLPPTTGSTEQLNAKQLSQEAQSYSAEFLSNKRLVAVRTPGPGADGKELGHDASRQPSSAAASRASAAYLLMNGALETPRRSSRLTGAAVDMGMAVSGSMPEAVGCEATFSASSDGPPSSMTESATELSEPVSSSLEAATEELRVPTTGSAEQRDAKQLSQEARNRSAELQCDELTARAPGPSAESKGSGSDASRQPSSAAASRASAALFLMTGAKGPPRRASTLTGAAVDIGAALSSSMPATVECKVAFSGSAERPPSIMTAAVAEPSEPLSSSVEAATRLRAHTTGNAEQLDAKQPSREAESRSAESLHDKTLVTLQAPGPGAEDKEFNDAASRQPSSAAASRANAAYLLMSGALGTPKRAGTLTGAAVDIDVPPSSSTPATIECNQSFPGNVLQPPSSVTAALAETSEPVSSSVEAATRLRAPISGDAEQRHSDGQEAGQGSYTWHSIRVSIRGSFVEVSSQFKKRRWTLLLVTPKSKPTHTWTQLMHVLKSHRLAR